MTELKTYTNTYTKYGKVLHEFLMIPTGLKIIKVSISPDFIDEDKPNEPVLYELYLKFEGNSSTNITGSGCVMETFGHHFTLNTYEEAVSLAAQIIKDMNGE